jgi:hypothetical protein
VSDLLPPTFLLVTEPCCLQHFEQVPWFPASRVSILPTECLPKTGCAAQGKQWCLSGEHAHDDGVGRRLVAPCLKIFDLLSTGSSFLGSKIYRGPFRGSFIPNLRLAYPVSAGDNTYTLKEFII